MPDHLWMPGGTRWLEGDCNEIASESPREGCVTLDHIRDNTKQYDSRGSGMQIMQWNLFASIDGCMRTYDLTTSSLRSQFRSQAKLMSDSSIVTISERKMWIGKLSLGMRLEEVHFPTSQCRGTESGTVMGSCCSGCLRTSG